MESRDRRGLVVPSAAGDDAAAQRSPLADARPRGQHRVAGDPEARAGEQAAARAGRTAAVPASVRA